MKLAWATDIHLDFVDGPDVLVEAILQSEPEAVLLGGDISTAFRIVADLQDLQRRLDRPVYYVLGNHDYYDGSIEAVRKEVRASLRSDDLRWLTESGPVPLGPGAWLVGVGGWGDAQFGDYPNAVMLNDFRKIAELSWIDPAVRRERLQALGHEAARHLDRSLAKLDDAEQIVVLTHVPPFEGACWHEGRISGPKWLPHFTCKATGDVLLSWARAHPDCDVVVLCGHTHGQGQHEALPNLRVWTGGADYGRPGVAGLLEV